MAAEYVCCSLTLQQNLLLRQPIACYEIAKRTYNFVVTYVVNRTINMTLVVLFLVGNNVIYLQYYNKARQFYSHKIAPIAVWRKY